MSMMALIMGGHIRIGMEDNIYYSRGVLAKTNAQFVEPLMLPIADDQPTGTQVIFAYRGATNVSGNAAIGFPAGPALHQSL